jgi:hypothetical protein
MDCSVFEFPSYRCGCLMVALLNRWREDGGRRHLIIECRDCGATWTRRDGVEGSR